MTGQSIRYTWDPEPIRGEVYNVDGDLMMFSHKHRRKTRPYSFMIFGADMPEDVGATGNPKGWRRVICED